MIIKNVIMLLFMLLITPSHPISDAAAYFES